MNTAHHGGTSWKAELSEATDRLSSKIERVCLGLGNAIARALRKVGLRYIADLFASP